MKIDKLVEKNGLVFDLDYIKVPEINRRTKSERKEQRRNRWLEYMEDDLFGFEMDYQETIQYQEWEKESPLSTALLDEEKFYDMFCDGTFWYFWTMDKLREILGENRRQVQTCIKEEEIKKLRDEQRNLERLMVHVKSKHECRSMMVEALKTKGKLKWAQESKRRNEVKLIQKEDVEEKDRYIRLFTKFREVSKSLEELELANLANLQELIPKKFMERGGIDMEEDSKVREIMNIITNSWKDTGGCGMKYVNKERCLDIILNTTFLAMNDKFVYNDRIPQGKKKMGLIKDLKYNTWNWFRWRKKAISNEEMWKLCIKFEKDMEEAGIKGKKITEAYDENMFDEEIWTFYEVGKWFPEEAGKRRFSCNGEENLDESDNMNQLGSKRKGRIKEERKGKGKEEKTSR
jgi:hypothetical protein